MKNMTLFKAALVASAVALFAFGAKPAFATCEDGTGAPDCVAAEGHISASVASTLDVHEISPIKFGNFKVTIGATGGDATIQLGPDGSRQKTNGGTNSITLLHGASMVNPETVTGVADPSNLATGSQAPGFYSIDGGNGTDGVFVTFSDINGNPIDANHDATTATSNHVVLTCLTCTDNGNTFFVDKFTFVTTDAAGNLNTPSQTDTDGFGQFTATDLAGHAIIKVGATLHTDPGLTSAGTQYDDGAYRGTFYIMVSY